MNCAAVLTGSLFQKLFVWINRWPQLSLCLLVVGCYALLKTMMIAGQFLPDMRLWIFALICLIAIPFSRFNLTSLPRPSRLIFAGIALLFAGYLLAAYPAMLPEQVTPETWVEFNLYRWVGTAFCLLALWRPVWLIPAMMAARWQKVIVSEINGMSISPTDYMPVLEFGIMLSLGACLFWAGQRWFKLWQSTDDKKSLSPQEAVLLTAVAVHFANYFYSGLQKIIISSPWWQWAVDNPTYYLMLAAWEMGALPLTVLGQDITGALYQGFVASVVWLNWATLMMQLFAVLAMFRIRWIVLTTALYDLSHIIIFLTTGIFFYKWIWLNLLIVAGLVMIQHKPISRALQCWLIGVLLLAPSIFFVARLGWFDTPSYNDEYIEAVTENNEIYRAPYNYFLAKSITHAQQRLIRGKPEHFLTGAYGVLYQGALPQLSLEQARTCTMSVTDTGDWQEILDKRNLTAYLKDHHQFVLSRLDENGRFMYDLYPHHIWTMPWEYSNFHQLDKRSIISYNYVVESKCLQFTDGHPQPEILKKTVHHVPISQQSRQ